MNKTTLTAVILSMVSLALGSFALYQNYSSQSIAYVDSSALLDKYQGMIDARTEYQKKAASWEANIDTLESEVKAAIMDYEKEASKMSTKEKELSQELIRTKQRQFRDYQEAIQQQAQQEDQAMTQRVLDKVNVFITDFGKRNNYKIIFGTTNGNIVYAEDGLDITDEVVELLNKDYLGL